MHLNIKHTKCIIMVTSVGVMLVHLVKETKKKEEHKEKVKKVQPRKEKESTDPILKAI